MALVNEVTHRLRGAGVSSQSHSVHCERRGAAFSAQPEYTPRVPSPRPPFVESDAERTALDVFGIDGPASEMPSYDDRNFRIETEDRKYTLKVSMRGERREILDLQDQVMQRLAGCSFAVPQIVPTLEGERVSEVQGGDGERYLARLLTYLPGELFVHARPHSQGLIHDVGRVLGELTQALDGFEHPAMDREFKWDLLRAESVFTPDILELATKEGRAELLDHFLRRFREYAFPVLPTLRRSVVHNDVNDYNLLVESTHDGQRVTGLIDFGDVIRSATVAELAISSAYAAMYSEEPLKAVAEIAGAFHAVFPLSEEEIAALFDLVCLRLCVSMCISSDQRRLDPGNAHILVSEDDAHRLLRTFSEISPEFACATLRHACGFGPDDIVEVP